MSNDTRWPFRESPRLSLSPWLRSPGLAEIFKKKNLSVLNWTCQGDSSEGPKRRPILELGIPMKPQNSTSAPAWATVGTGPSGSHCDNDFSKCPLRQIWKPSPNEKKTLDGISDIKYLLKPAKQSYLHPRHAVKSVTWGFAAISALQPTRPARTGWSKNRPTNILDP